MYGLSSSCFPDTLSCEQGLRRLVGTDFTILLTAFISCFAWAEHKTVSARKEFRIYSISLLFSVEAPTSHSCYENNTNEAMIRTPPGRIRPRSSFNRGIHRRPAPGGECRTGNGEAMPRLSPGGVTPEHKGSNQEMTKKTGENRQYREEQQRKEVRPCTKTAWDIAREVLAAVPPSNLRIVTDFRFFLKRPLRKLTDLHKRVLGNFQAVFSDLS